MDSAIQDSGGPILKSRPNSYDYFDLDDILATQERVPSKLEVPVHNLGFLDPNSEGEHLQAGMKMELPFWLAKDLCSRRRRIASVELPKPYREGYRQILKADANVVDLHKLGPYYYNFGTKLLHFSYDENSQVAQSLQEAFMKRARKIMDSSQHVLNEDTTKLTCKLDHIELQAFKAGLHGIRNFQLWEKGITSKLTTSTIVTNHRKRKRAVLQD